MKRLLACVLAVAGMLSAVAAVRAQPLDLPPPTIVAPPPLSLPPPSILIPPPAPEPRQTTPEAPRSRIVAIGDLHGDHGAFRAIMAAAGLIDASGAWSGGTATLVQTGDLADRGPDTLLIVRDLMRLQREAAAAGGRVVVLIGNHEAMNVSGDLRYVHPGEYAAFATAHSGERRREFYQVNQAAIERLYRSRVSGLSEDEIRRAWIADTPLGKIEHQEAWGPAGEVGAWIAANPAVALIEGNLFAHGGINAEYAALPVDEINRRAAAEIAVREASRRALINDPEGPLWYRGYFLREADDPQRLASPEAVARELDRVLAAYGARRIVVGHTPALAPIRVLHGGRLIAIDTGISAHYGGPRTYLVIAGDAVVPHVVSQGGSQ